MLKEVCEAFLPVSDLRRKKRAYAANVVDEWFRVPLSKKIKDILLDPQSHIFATGGRP